MKSVLFATGLLALTVCFPTRFSLGADDGPSPERAGDNGAQEPIKDVFPRFSVVGDWHVTHPWWVDTLTLRADGTLFTHRMGSTGHWILTGDGGTPVIVLRWDLHGTESVSMVGPNQFRGQVKNGRFIDMRRGDDATGEKSEPVQPAR